MNFFSILGGKARLYAFAFHFCVSLLIALLVSMLIFGIWFPYPFRQISGGNRLFGMLMLVHFLIGPVLIWLIFDVRKPTNELKRDVAVIGIIQLLALAYGLWSVHQMRPLFLVHEVDRFKVIAQPDVAPGSLAQLSPDLRPQMLSGPRIVAIRDPLNDQERDKVLFEALQGGRDYAERPEFYLPFGADAARKSISNAKPLATFLERYPEQLNKFTTLSQSGGSDHQKWFTLPVVAREDWVAVLNERGEVRGFLRGDGF